MGWFDRFRKKSLPAPGGLSLAFVDGNYNQLSPWRLNSCAIEGYAGNPVVFACIDILAKSCASVTLEVHKTKRNGDNEILTKHDLMTLISKPNPKQTGKAFIRELATHYLYAGEAFVLGLPLGKKVKTELWLLEPRLVTVEKPDANSTAMFPISYKYGTGENAITYPVSQVDGSSDVYHIKTVNPLDPWRGLSAMFPAARSIDIHNEGMRWNATLLKNSAKPSGIVELPGSAEADGLNRLAEAFKRLWQGSSNAGGVAFLTGGAKFNPLSFNPKDMDFAKSLGEAAKNIALVFGVPLPIVTMDASTFSNMEAAMERLWSDTVLPLLDELIGGLSDFVTPGYADNVKLAYNADSVPALEAKRGVLFKRMCDGVKGGVITPNEARDGIGFDPLDSEGADDLLIPTTMMPLDMLDKEPAGEDDKKPVATDSEV